MLCFFFFFTLYSFFLSFALLLSSSCIYFQFATLSLTIFCVSFDCMSLVTATIRSFSFAALFFKPTFLHQHQYVQRRASIDDTKTLSDAYTTHSIHSKALLVYITRLYIQIQAYPKMFVFFHCAFLSCRCILLSHIIFWVVAVYLF